LFDDPSTITASWPTSTLITQRASRAMFTALRELGAVLNTTASSNQSAHSGAQCGAPLVRTVDTQ
jgi:hypothetical protein